VISIIFVIIGTIFYSMKPEKVVKNEYALVVKFTYIIDNENPDNLDFETEIELATNIKEDEKISLLKTNKNERKLMRIFDYEEV
jgi:hypothetical protein